jgi:glycosyltransferase involved in cell wall biosynthesis
MNVGTFFLNHDPSINVDGAKLVYFLHEIKKIECDKIIFSGIDSYEIIKKHNNLNKAKKINFLQGPDYLFPGNESRLHLFEESVKDSAKVIAQSPFLQNISDALGSITTTTVTLGPKQTIFFDQGLGKEKILLIPVRKDPDKGLRFILPAIKKIRAAGWKVVGFGDLVDNNLETYFDEFLGRITRTNLAKVFQKASLILDLSTYEGLGLIELEAGMCGVTSVINRKGGTDSLDRIKSEFIYIDNPLNFNEIVEKITQFDLAKANSTRSELASKFNLYSWENGIDQIISEIKKI